MNTSKEELLLEVEKRRHNKILKSYQKLSYLEKSYFDVLLEHLLLNKKFRIYSKILLCSGLLN